MSEPGRPSALLYLLVPLIPAVAFAAGWYSLLRDVEAMERFMVPAEHEFDQEPGTYQVYMETRSQIGEQYYEGGSGAGLSCSVRNAKGVVTPLLRTSDEPYSYSVGEFAGSALFEFDDEEGPATLNCFYAGVVGDRIVVAIGPADLGIQGRWYVVCAAAVSALALGLALLLKRRKTPGVRA